MLPREQWHVRQAILWACFAGGGINVIWVHVDEIHPEEAGHDLVRHDDDSGDGEDVQRRGLQLLLERVVERLDPLALFHVGVRDLDHVFCVALDAGHHLPGAARHHPEVVLPQLLQQLPRVPGVPP